MTDQKVNPFLWHTGVNPTKLSLLDRWAVGKRVVDVGCGNGAYAQHLREAGFKVIAIDVEDRVSNKEGINFLFSTVPPIPLPDNICDTLVLFDVLEHVAEEEELLAEIRRVTTQRLILSVPSNNDGTLPLYGLCHVHHVDKTHQREYSPESLKDVLGKHGLQITHIQAQHPVNAPLVVKEFFKPTPVSKVLQRMTVKWINFLRHRQIIQVDLPADWFVIADLISD